MALSLTLILNGDCRSTEIVYLNRKCFFSFPPSAGGVVVVGCSESTLRLIVWRRIGCRLCIAATLAAVVCTATGVFSWRTGSVLVPKKRKTSVDSLPGFISASITR